MRNGKTMNIVGILPVRNEEWVIGLSARVALKWCDSLVILNHNSTDRTAEIIGDLQSEYGDRVRVKFTDDSEWNEMPHREFLLNCARERGATHVAIVDADEVLCASSVETMRRNVECMWEEGILQIPLYNLRNGINTYHANGVWGNRIVSAAFKDYPVLGWRGDKFHSREPHGMTLKPYKPIGQGQGGVMHLWGNSERRLRAKCAAYKVAERLRWPHKPVAEIDRMYSWAIHGETDSNQVHHRAFGTPVTWTYREVPVEWWAAYEAEGLMQYLDVNAVPYQEQLVRDAIAKHGHEPFYGLDLFGLAK